MKSCIVVAYFAEVRERGFGDNGLDARFDRSGLKRDGSAHGNTQRIQVPDSLAGVKGVRDGNRVVTLLPAIGGHVAAALPMVARIHHQHAIAVAQQKLSVADHSCAIVRDAMKEEHPISVWGRW